MVVYTVKKIVNSIKLNQSMVEKCMLYQAVEKILDIYVIISKREVDEVVQKQIEAIYLTHGEDDQEVHYFV